MRHQVGIRARTVKEYKTTTNSKHAFPVAKDLLSRQFGVSRPRPSEPDVGGGHRPYRTQEGWLYLAVVLDLYSRPIVGWAMSDRRDLALTPCVTTPGAVEASAGAGIDSSFRSRQAVRDRGLPAASR